MSAAGSIRWIIGSQSYDCDREPGACPICLRPNRVVALPPPIRNAQPDGTTHVCHPSLGGCNHGFVKTASDEVAT